jgi:predicted nucleic acid-binding protein
MLLDTNIVIDACKSDGAWLFPWTQHPEAACASVTRVEALGFNGISAGEDTHWMTR